RGRERDRRRREKADLVAAVSALSGREKQETCARAMGCVLLAGRLADFWLGASVDSGRRAGAPAARLLAHGDLRRQRLGIASYDKLPGLAPLLATAQSTNAGADGRRVARHWSSPGPVFAGGRRAFTAAGIGDAALFAGQTHRRARRQ